jgi:hypothetical protein
MNLHILTSLDGLFLNYFNHIRKNLHFSCYFVVSQGILFCHVSKRSKCEGTGNNGKGILCTASLIFNLRTVFRLVASLMSQPLTTGRGASIIDEWEPVWIFWKRDKAHFATGIQTPDLSAYSLVAIPIKLYWLLL